MSTTTRPKTERRKLERLARKAQRRSLGIVSSPLASPTPPAKAARTFPLACVVTLVVLLASLAALASPLNRPASSTKPVPPAAPLQTAPNQVVIHLDDGGLAYATDSHITAVSGGDARHQQLLGLQYTVGSVDDTDYHPLLWRSAELSLQKPDGSVAEVSASRPLWWFERTGAKEGATVPLDIHEAGISGLATVHQVTSLADKPYEPPTNDDYRQVIGTIKHLNASVIALTFEGAEDQPLGVTPNHPLWSEDRQDWVPADELRIGERVATADAAAPARLLRSEPQPGGQTVYNIEVHRSHSYHVGELGLMAHNTGLNCDERIFSVLNVFLKQNGGDIWAAYARLFERMPLLEKNYALRAQAFGEALRLHLERTPGVFDLAALRQKLVPGGVPIGSPGGQAGKIRELTGSRLDAEYFLRDLAPGCKVTLRPDYADGVPVRTPNGGFMGVRYVMSKSPSSNATIEVNIPGIPEIIKLKFNP